MLKTSLLSLFVLIQLAASVYAQSVTLAWDPNSQPNIAGYNIYRSDQSGTFPSPPLIGATPKTTTTFTDSTAQYNSSYYYSVTAVSTTGEQSAYSTVQAIIGPPRTTNPPPGVLRTTNPADLVGYWKLDEGSGMSSSDSSSSGITGILVNGPAWTTGRSGNAVLFDGLDDYIDLGNPIALNFGTRSFTYSLWVQVSQRVG